MKILFLMMTCSLMLAGFGISAEETEISSNECVEGEGEDEEECRTIKFRRPPSYDNSLIVNPIERDFPVSRPSSHESSFYEQMTR